MSFFTYTFTKPTVCETSLVYQIKDETQITPSVSKIENTHLPTGNLKISFGSELSGTEQSILSGIVAAHAGVTSFYKPVHRKATYSQSILTLVEWFEFVDLNDILSGLSSKEEYEYTDNVLTKIISTEFYTDNTIRNRFETDTLVSATELKRIVR